ncbi:MAG TPA: hypothetical protein VMD27_07530 [Candidatus Aquilonibacter sp.]|nr:hypothetical protein [Candidatus Aquilonibacter sp.]
MRFKQFVFLCFFCAAAAVFADDNSKPVALSETPAAVQKAINARIGGGTLGEIDVTAEDGENVYDVSLTATNGDARDFSVADDGTLLSVEVELAETPVAVRNTIRSLALGWELEGIDKNLDDTEISYDFEVTKDGQEKDFTIGDDGTLWSEEITLSKAPVMVQKTIQARMGAGKLTEIDEMFDDDGITYDVEVTANSGEEQSFTVSTNGAVVSEEVTLEKTTPGAQRTIKNRIGDGTILRIDKSLLEREDGVLPYEVQGRKDGKPFDFSVGPRGRFLGMDD